MGEMGLRILGKANWPSIKRIHHFLLSKLRLIILSVENDKNTRKIINSYYYQDIC